ncbi:MAG: SUF system NifU family Fe-S cluster assembly protein [Bacilli bacterium]|nr:SUF system NifU family Fe-S cluster assembly protein [Bacilli bacterium]
MDTNLKKEIIMDHYLNPKNKITTDDSRYVKVNTNNESCIDNLNFYVLFNGDLIEDIKFDGEACAISTSSSSIMITNMIGKTIAEAEEYINNFEAMINEEKYNSDILNEANAYDDIYKQNNRKNCALLPYKGIKKAIAEYRK